MATAARARWERSPLNDVKVSSQQQPMLRCAANCPACACPACSAWHARQCRRRHAAPRERASPAGRRACSQGTNACCARRSSGSGSKPGGRSAPARARPLATSLAQSRGVTGARCAYTGSTSPGGRSAALAYTAAVALSSSQQLGRPAAAAGGRWWARAARTLRQPFRALPPAATELAPEWGALSGVGGRTLLQIAHRACPHEPMQIAARVSGMHPQSARRGDRRHPGGGRAHPAATAAGRAAARGCPPGARPSCPARRTRRTPSAPSSAAPAPCNDCSITYRPLCIGVG